LSLKRIAVFVEGQGELIFIRNLLDHLFDDIQFSFECLKLHGASMQDIPYNRVNPLAVVHFKLINVQNDSKVLTAIQDREEGLIKAGYDKIIGLRDMYSRQYKRRSPGIIDKDVCSLFIDGANTVIKGMSAPDKVSMHFSIMEVEAWWLSMYSLFEKIHNCLTEEHIHNNLGYKLSEIDVENHFFHPASDLTAVLDLADIKYGKKLSDVESITNNIDILDVSAAVEGNRCATFKAFCNDLLESAGSTYCLE